MEQVPTPSEAVHVLGQEIRSWQASLDRPTCMSGMHGLVEDSSGSSTFPAHPGSLADNLLTSRRERCKQKIWKCTPGCRTPSVCMLLHNMMLCRVMGRSPCLRVTAVPHQERLSSIISSPLTYKSLFVALARLVSQTGLVPTSSALLSAQATRSLIVCLRRLTTIAFGILIRGHPCPIAPCEASFSLTSLAIVADQVICRTARSHRVCWLANWLLSEIPVVTSTLRTQVLPTWITNKCIP
ncbi:hypothetical protein F5Y18DRAFT_48406 [Xylariaceae sp. FL1019]|nr:hypothetical protein F5Y18DRAFT_48406 [Xylariaceae sp. FL1019]